MPAVRFALLTLRYAASAVIGSVLALFTLTAMAKELEPTKAPETTIEQTVREFLMAETASLGDSVEITVRDGDSALGECVAPDPFLPRPGIPKGRVTVGLHCAGESARTRYVQATVSATIRHLVAARTLDPGDPVDAAALTWATTDITRLQRGYLDSMERVTGKVATRRIPSGATLTDAMVRAPWLVERGSSVVLVARGDGFSISRSVEALDNGGLGSSVRLKTQNNQILQGRVIGPDRLAVEF
ncbi:flagellar basal body P-ring formation chaperone FlgA [Salinicola aestuarinus]|uniref:flagellar basal body P-ring formation chaperone FlgA n=1 Tax=Salinicola aestuarinus TaxID=1949082 RepID=UPI0013002E69|nr:flagellar basal body P-ring formation chaperone FlgA [Salinicola aestuarinus]